MLDFRNIQFQEQDDDKEPGLKITGRLIVTAARFVDRQYATDTKLKEHIKILLTTQIHQHVYGDLIEPVHNLIHFARHPCPELARFSDAFQSRLQMIDKLQELLTLKY